MKTIIASDHIRNTILQELAEENGGQVSDVRVLSLSALLKEERDDTTAASLALSEALNRDRDSYHVFKEMFSYPAFIQEILSFAEECVLYDIDPASLPADSVNEEELKKILTVALSQDLAVKANRASRDARIRSISELRDAIMYPSFCKDHYHYAIAKQISQKIPSHAAEEVHPQLHLRIALNTRQEAEAIAQDIARRSVPCNIILTDGSSQLPLFSSVFMRYGIPFSGTHETAELHLPKVFEALCAFAIHPDRDSFLRCLRLDAFEKKCPSDVTAFLQNTLTDLVSPEHLSEQIKDTVFEDDYERISDLEERSAEYFASIREDLDLLVNAEDASAKLQAAFLVLTKVPCLSDRNELACGTSMRRSILACMEHVQSDDDLMFLARSLSSHSIKIEHEESRFCVITDLTHPVPARPVTYVVSVSGTNYPGVPVMSGLFDEAYLEKIPAYPSQDVRHHEYMEQLKWIESSASEELIYSCPSNDYQGREVQAAFEIEQIFGRNSEKWQLDTLAPAIVRPHSLSRETAQELFLRDGSVHGSISTIERWFACPYSYFIQSGLHVRKHSETDLDAAGAGTIQHALLEHGLNTKHKQYAEMSEEEIREILQPAFTALQAMHPLTAPEINMSEERMTKSIWSALQFLNDFEHSTSFEPSEAEKKFEENIIPGVRLRGTIDRLDLYGKEMLRIVDYKSSTHALSETKIKAGAQLQLLSYLMIAQRLYERDPAGAYYFSMKEASYNVPASSVSRNVVTETDFSEDAERERYLKGRQLKGWTFTDRKTELDENAAHIASLKSDYDYEAVKQCINMLYQLFHDELTKGNISLDPREDACTFCDYRRVCRFHGIRRKAEPLVMKDVKLRKGKEDQE